MHGDNRTYAVYRQLMLEARQAGTKQVKLDKKASAMAVRARLYAYMRWARVNDPAPDLLRAFDDLQIRVEGDTLIFCLRGEDPVTKVLAGSLENKPELPEQVVKHGVVSKLDVEAAEMERRLQGRLQAHAAEYLPEPEGKPTFRNPYAEVLRHKKG